MPCQHCIDAAHVFDSRTARWERLSHRVFGPRRSSRHLIQTVEELGGTPFSLLDIGSGIGAVPEALSGTFSTATIVDAAPAYLSIHRDRAVGWRDRTLFLEGDFVDLAADIDPHDVVTLDRVLCCYPDAERLVRAVAGRATRLMVFVFPREGRLARLLFPVFNRYLALRGSSFRVFLHGTELVDTTASEAGWTLAETRRTSMWQIRAYVPA